MTTAVKVTPHVLNLERAQLLTLGWDSFIVDAIR